MNAPAILGIVALLLVPACGGEGEERWAAAAEEGSGPPHQPTGATEQELSPDEARDLAIAFGLPRIVAVNAYLSRYLVVEAVYQATALSGAGAYGQVMNTGTLTTEYGALQYLPQPTDRLVLRLGQETHEFVVMDAQGNVQAPSATAWLGLPHVLRYKHVLPGQAEVELAVQFDGLNFQSEMVGWYEQTGLRYDLDLVASGQSATQRDMTGQEARTEYDLTGTVSRDGFRMEVNEHHLSTLAAASHPSRLLPSQRGSASRFNGTLNNVVWSGETEFRFIDVQVQTDMMARGGTGSAGLSHLEGQVLRGGAPFGRCVSQAGQAFLDIGSRQVALDLGLPG